MKRIEKMEFLQHPPMSQSSASSPQNPLSFPSIRAVGPVAAWAGLPEHAPVFLMPHLDPLLPLVLVEFMLLQDSGKTMGDKYFKAQSPNAGGKESPLNSLRG